jgi:hypothetical protein
MAARLMQALGSARHVEGYGLLGAVQDRVIVVGAGMSGLAAAYRTGLHHTNAAAMLGALLRCHGGASGQRRRCWVRVRLSARSSAASGPPLGSWVASAETSQAGTSAMGSS